MGYVKLNKASDAFDILSAEDLGSCGFSSDASKAGKISVMYIGDGTMESLITPVDWVVGDTSTHFVQADVQAIVKAIGLIGGGAGMQNTDELSKDVASVSRVDA
tara:strand:- start:1628 stop:1939 length:312 start_codon:yes stop_codon:yes gene_type:complete